MKTLTVHLGQRSYPIVIGAPINGLGPWLRKKGYHGTVMIVTNTTVARLYRKPVENSLSGSGFKVSCAVVKDGEQYKTLDTVQRLYHAAVKNGLDRSSLAVALGGGVVGDIAGFFSATYMRGIPCVQVPTTLLAMVDSSVGGKTGVDLKEGKNLVGAFHQPKAVWIDPGVLSTLSRRHVNNGMAEVIKYGIVADYSFFKYLEKILFGDKKITIRQWEAIIHRCCALKASIVERDEFETKGLRAILNYGHTFGHAIEGATGYRKYLHGEAVAIGMAAAGRCAVSMGMFSKEKETRVETLISKVGLSLITTSKIPYIALIRYMCSDKKVHQGKLRFILPVDIGTVKVVSDVPEEVLKKVV